MELRAGIMAKEVAESNGRKSRDGGKSVRSRSEFDDELITSATYRETQAERRDLDATVTCCDPAPALLEVHLPSPHCHRQRITPKLSPPLLRTIARHPCTPQSTFLVLPSISNSIPTTYPRDLSTRRVQWQGTETEVLKPLRLASDPSTYDPVPQKQDFDALRG